MLKIKQRLFQYVLQENTILIFLFEKFTFNCQDFLCVLCSVYQDFYFEVCFLFPLLCSFTVQCSCGLFLFAFVSVVSLVCFHDNSLPSPVPCQPLLSCVIKPQCFSCSVSSVVLCGCTVSCALFPVSACLLPPTLFFVLAQIYFCYFVNKLNAAIASYSPSSLKHPMLKFTCTFLYQPSLMSAATQQIKSTKAYADSVLFNYIPKCCLIPISYSENCHD